VKRLQSKVVIVTGSSKGIGAASAIKLASEGASVVVNFYRGEVGARELVNDIVNSGGSAIAVRADISKEAGVSTLFEATQRTFGSLDILVNNAGIFERAPLDKITEDHFYRHFNLNVLGLILSCQQAIKFFGRNGGTIVNISSIVSTTAPACSTVYNATKAAVDSITKTLAKELAPRSIRVNAINPGLVDTEGLRATGFVKHLRKLATLTPPGRILLPEEVACAVAYFASPASSPLTGRTFDLSVPFRDGCFDSGTQV
jgi:3-oxoacyl-[acyl-carrier protein] reductase